MKKFLILVMLTLGMGLISHAQTGYNAALGVLDTLTNADTTTYVVSVTGIKHSITFQTNTLKISGTVAGTIKVYGSIDGTNYITTPLTTVNFTDASVNYSVAYTYNGYTKYKYQLISSGTCSLSDRTWILYR